MTLVTATAVLGTAPGAGAAPAPAGTFRPVPEDKVLRKGALGAGKELVTVVVEVAGDPVTVAAAAAPLSAEQKREHKRDLRARQTPVEQRVKELGGTVLGSYQSAYNGLRVRIAADKVPALRDGTDVVDVHPVRVMRPDNVRGVSLIGAPAAWSGANGLRGENMKIAVIDTGIDYTHATFGGPGTPAAYTAAHAAETAPANPALFGPGAAKIKGGVDLVGDSYNADPTSPTYQPVPHPDPNPLDCNGHGTHVAGTAAGFGVLGDGRTYQGQYDARTIESNDWIVGPGSAPKADLYAVRVFGCGGSTDVTVDAIEWAVDHGMDVINMSLGSPLGTGTDPDAVAANNAARAGVIVVASAGNSGPAPYITGSPATGTHTISVAASDPTTSFPGARLTLSTGTSLDAIVANGVTIGNQTYPVKVLRNGPTISLGCDPAEYAVAAGAVAVVQRGTCARVARAVYGQKAGARAVIMVNNVDSLPPFEGPITSNPDTGEQYRVTIPFLGVPSSAGAALLAADGGQVSLSALTLSNPNYLKPASFTSGGPRSGDSWLKPDVTAPGVSIFSAGVGAGTGTTALSGTSMAAPHTAGVAALVKQAHPTWNDVQYWKAAIVNTADPAKVNDYSTRIAGSGLVQVPPAVQTQVVALGDAGTSTLNYGFAELDRNLGEKKMIVLRNFSGSPVTFDAASTRAAGSPHTVKLKKSRVTVPARGSVQFEVELTVPAATAGDSSAFRDVAGLVVFTPVKAGDNNGVALRVPYYLVPQAVSNIESRIDLGKLRRDGSTTATVTNRRGAITGVADWYAWGLSDSRDRGSNSADLRAVGAQRFDGGLAFAISTYHRWSNASTNTFEVKIDVNQDRVDDYLVRGQDYGVLTTGDPTGELATAVFDLRTGGGTLEFFADAPTDSSTVVLPVLTEQLCQPGSPCLSEANPRLTYHVDSFGTARNGTRLTDTIDGTASFNAFSPAITTGVRDVVAPNATVTRTVSVNRAEWRNTPAKGFMIVSPDNRSGGDDAQLISVFLS